MKSEQKSLVEIEHEKSEVRMLRILWEEMVANINSESAKQQNIQNKNNAQAQDYSVPIYM